MKHRLLASIWAITILCGHWATAEELSGSAVIERYLEVQAIDSELAFIDMETAELGDEANPHKKHRFLAITQKDAGGDYSYLMRIMRPFEVEGLSVLATAEAGVMAQYLYLPAVGKVSRLSSESQKGAFLGSDFSYSDMVRERPSNFEYTLLADARVRGFDCYVVRSKPVVDAADFDYSYRELYIGKEDFLLHRINFFNEQGDKIKYMEAEGYRSTEVKGETVRPRRAVMVNLRDQSQTTFQVIESRLNLKLDSSYFTTEHMKAWTSEEVRKLVFGYGFTVMAEKPDLL